MKTYQCDDGFATKFLLAESIEDAADMFAIVPCDVRVAEVDPETHCTIGPVRVIRADVAA